MGSGVRWTAESLAEAAGGSLMRRSDRPIAGAFIDSRNPLPGGVFVPIVAARDGHDFLEHAVVGGASAVLVGRGRAAPTGDLTVVEVNDTQEAFDALARDARARCQGPVVAITGSNGKTTTRAMITAVLEAGDHRVLSTWGNFNNHLGVPLTLCGEPHDPTAMAIELGMSAPGENDHLASIVHPDIAVITSIALEHVEFMGTLEAIAAAEAEPVPHIREGGALVVPGDEPLLRPFWPASGRMREMRPGSWRSRWALARAAASRCEVAPPWS
jgi:UDP-N-acetylmuramoyl-tripeptide--D-alanyl-D-alanine ligase